VWALAKKELGKIIKEDLGPAPEAPPDAPAVEMDSDDEIEAAADVAAQDAAKKAQQRQPWEKPGLTYEQIADACIKVFRETPATSDGSFTLPKGRCSLKWWRAREKNGMFGPYLPKLARRALATPATSAPVERVFSKCALITTRNRNRLSADSITLTMFLKEAWGKVREMGLQGAVEGMFSEDEEEVE
jgi:hypothetical protein